MKRGERYKDTRTGEIVVINTWGDFSVSANTPNGPTLISHANFKNYCVKVD